MLLLLFPECFFEVRVDSLEMGVFLEERVVFEVREVRLAGLLLASLLAHLEGILTSN